jgi:hypothetical protein
LNAVIKVECRHQGYAIIRVMLSSGLFHHQGYAIIRVMPSSGLCHHQGYAIIRVVLSSGLCCHQGSVPSSGLSAIIIFEKINCIA